jgi:PTH2 family peptidyl-tRNA hydrolase
MTLVRKVDDSFLIKHYSAMFSWFKSTSQSQAQKRGETVQYLIARQDIEMSPGKLAAQCSHASSSIVLAHLSRTARQIQNSITLQQHQPAFSIWAQSSFAKVVLRVKSRSQLLKLCDQLDASFLPYAPIFDACRTELTPEEANGSILTCIGLTPLFKSDAPPYLKKLQVYK